MAPRIDDVGENAGWPAEDVVLQRDPLEHGNVVLNLDIVADAHVGCYEDVLPHHTVAADLDIRHHVREVPDPGPRTYGHGLLDDGGLMDEEFGGVGCQWNLRAALLERFLARGQHLQHLEGSLAAGQWHCTLPDAAQEIKAL